MMLRSAFRWVTLAVTLCLPSSAVAHSMYQSSVLIDVHGNTVTLEVQLPPSRLGEALNLDLTAASLGLASHQIRDYVQSQLSVSGPEDNPWSLTRPTQPEWRIVDGAPYVVLSAEATPPANHGARHFKVTDRIITDRLHSHAILVSMRSDWESNYDPSAPDLIGIITSDEPSVDVNLGPGRWTKGFVSVFHLGLRHIAEGTDHLLFLLALLLPAPLTYIGRHWAGPINVRRSCLQIVKIASAFTIGHSLTLALAAFGVVHLPEPPIEILIALSILISAVHALRPIFPGQEAFVAAGFGLIHGLAFATTLADLGLHGWERFQGILAFNLGIETMQLIVIGCVMPSLLLLSRTRLYTTFRISGGAFAILASCGWIIERSTGRALHVDDVVNIVATRGGWLAASLFLGSLLAYLYSRSKLDSRGLR